MTMQDPPVSCFCWRTLHKLPVRAWSLVAMTLAWSLNEPGTNVQSRRSLVAVCCCHLDNSLTGNYASPCSSLNIPVLLPASLLCSIPSKPTAQHSAAQPTAAQHPAAQRTAAQHGTVQHNTLQHSTLQHSTLQHSTAQHSTAQHSTAHCSGENAPDASQPAEEAAARCAAHRLQL